ncbi:pilus assembly protein PilP [Oceanisphaera ostreae]|uniref:Pilus assembly protein PilP n=1 Tax=Oceanisphaera ostreae TaxID=914151 RepID=A0ABW3KIL9_9GAMM
MIRLLRYYILPMPHRLLLITLFATIACSEQQSVASYIDEESAKPGQALTSLSAPALYQPRPYKATVQRSPFMPAQPISVLTELKPSDPLVPALGCEAKSELQEMVLSAAVFSTWTLRATFTNGNKTAALIHTPSIGIQTVTVGQQLTPLPSRSRNPSEIPHQGQAQDLIEVTAITSQQLTLKHQRTHSPKCTKIQVVTLNLYDD